MKEAIKMQILQPVFRSMGKITEYDIQESRYLLENEHHGKWFQVSIDHVLYFLQLIKLSDGFDLCFYTREIDLDFGTNAECTRSGMYKLQFGFSYTKNISGFKSLSKKSDIDIVKQFISETIPYDFAARYVLSGRYLYKCLQIDEFENNEYTLYWDKQFPHCVSVKKTTALFHEKAETVNITENEALTMLKIIKNIQQGQYRGPTADQLKFTPMTNLKKLSNHSRMSFELWVGSCLDSIFNSDQDISTISFPDIPVRLYDY